ncbi:hypothetical protein LEP1GSC062_2547 [Leptospira alexanderi serovar Manhao 3 str. L 60]|uniref:Uncharacterized protein n=1 Tax=Leptospira alexanderi serovar Manhao 3 str. L 60 TaxID=1049759 RepID=V6I0D2_9LEPT|nr:hypothetical protein LEP1GSC062_2547 [Leptospira alexanderi serovar Manhao 3 str. L 60]
MFRFLEKNNLYSSLHNRVSKILRLNVGFVLKLTIFYFIGISNKNKE